MPRQIKMDFSKGIPTKNHQQLIQSLLRLQWPVYFNEINIISRLFLLHKATNSTRNGRLTKRAIIEKHF